MKSKLATGYPHTPAQHSSKAPGRQCPRAQTAGKFFAILAPPMNTIDDTLRKVPPQSIEAEESVLGGVLLDNTALDRALEFIVADDFYREAHRKIMRAMIE